MVFMIISILICLCILDWDLLSKFLCGFYIGLILWICLGIVMSFIIEPYFPVTEKTLSIQKISINDDYIYMDADCKTITYIENEKQYEVPVSLSKINIVNNDTTPNLIIRSKNFKTWKTLFIFNFMYKKEYEFNIPNNSICFQKVIEYE